MSKILILSVSVLWSLVSGALASADERPVVAVFDIQLRGLKLSQMDRVSLSDYLASRLAESGKFQVIPRDQLVERLASQKRSSFKACYDQRCQIEIGRELAAQKSLASKIMKLGSKCTLTASLFDLRKATTDLAATAKGGCSIDDLTAAIDKIADKLTANRHTLGPRQTEREGAPPSLFAPPEANCSTPADCFSKGYKAEQAKDWLTAVPFYRRACDGGNAGGCNNLGYATEKGYGTTKDLAAALRLYQHSCQKGDAVACKNVGVFYENGRGIPKDYARALLNYRRACDKNHMAGCNNLGYMLEKGKGVPADEAGAVRLYVQACEGNHAKGCKNAGVMYKNGRGVPADLQRALDFYRRACDGGSMGGCNNLGFAYERGQGVPRDVPRAFKLYLKSCNGGDMVACKNVGVMYRNGMGVGRDLNQTRFYYRKSCDGGHQQACEYLKSL